MSKHIQIREGQFSDIMPDMSDDEFEALKRSIEENGFDETTPIVVDENGQIVDGHHRFKACKELDVEPEHIIVEDPEPEQAYRVNLARRNLNDGTKRKVVADYLVGHWDGNSSLEGVAESLGVSSATVSKAKQLAEEMENPSSREWFSKAERRQQARDYIDEYPDASNREVTNNIEADVSHATIGNWRRKWESEDDEIAADESSTKDSASDEEGQDTTHQQQSPTTAQSGGSSDEEDASGEADTTGVSSPTQRKQADSGPSDGAEETDEPPTSRAEALERQLEMKNQTISELDRELQEKRQRPKPEDIESISAFVNGAYSSLPEDPSDFTEHGLQDAIKDARVKLEDAQAKLEELV